MEIPKHLYRTLNFHSLHQGLKQRIGHERNIAVVMKRFSRETNV